MAKRKSRHYAGPDIDPQIRLDRLSRVRLLDFANTLANAPRFDCLDGPGLASLAVEIALAVVKAGRLAEFIQTAPAWQIVAEQMAEQEDITNTLGRPAS